MNKPNGWTGGPWVTDGEGIRMLVRDANTGVIIAVRHRLPARDNERFMKRIAAAPDLYEALAELLSSVDENADEIPYRIAPVVAKARAALSRAEGEGK